VPVLGIALTMVADARQADPGVQLRAAIEKEEVAGDLEGAMALYRQIIAADGKNRPATAKAMLRLAGCYEKLGQAEARKLYERLVAEYSDQTQEAAHARARLAALGSPEAKPKFTKILVSTGFPRTAPLEEVETGLEVNHADMAWSPEGTTIAFAGMQAAQREFWLMEDFVRLVKPGVKR